MAALVLLLVALGGALLVLFLGPRQIEEAGQTRRIDDSIQNRFQGTWEETSMNMGGNPIPGAVAQLIFKDNQMTLAGVSGTYRIDTARKPMHLDWTVQGVVSHWVFEVRGDELTLAILQAFDGPPGKEPSRPTDFNPQPGKNVMTFKRR
jgi:uncharacterized protein (TIGR03067 family)